MEVRSTQIEQSEVMDPLREEHRELLPHIEALADAGDAIGSAPLEEQRAKVEQAYTFLTDHLIPHATAEDDVLYGEVDGLLGSAGGVGATDTMRRDHVEVARLTGRLGELASVLREREMAMAEERELRQILYGLHAIVALHFAKEEEVYVPLLERALTSADAAAMFERMERAAARAGGHA